MTPRVIGNIKGLQDPYRNPTTQKGFAEKWGQNPAMVTSFADGSKISFEQAIVANATGFKVQSRGMSRGMEYKDDVMFKSSCQLEMRSSANWFFEEPRLTPNLMMDCAQVCIGIPSKFSNVNRVFSKLGNRMELKISPPRNSKKCNFFCD